MTQTIPRLLPESRPSTGTCRALTQDDVLRAVLAQLDGTSLTRAGAVSQSWRQAATAEPLWRALVYRERGRLVAFQARPAQPPAWAIEQPQTLACPSPPRSWRQGYRLLAMLERGRANCEAPIPSIVPLPSLPEGRRLPGRAPPPWVPVEAAWDLLAGNFANLPALRGQIVDGLSGRRRQFTQLGTTVAIRDPRGNVLVAWHDGGRAHSWQLPLRALGRPAGEVMLHEARPGDPPGVGAVHLLTRSNKRWFVWQARQPQPAVTLAGRTGRVIHIQDKACWLASGIPEGTQDGFGLFSLQTGRALDRAVDNNRLTDTALLTELGPLVAWTRPAWHVRICWSTRPQAADLPVNRDQASWRQTFWGNRPMRLYIGLLPPGAQVFDMRLSEAEPGRVLLWWTNATTAGEANVSGGFVDGWGSYKTCTELSKVTGAPADDPCVPLCS